MRFEQWQLLRIYAAILSMYSPKIIHKIKSKIFQKNCTSDSLNFKEIEAALISEFHEESITSYIVSKRCLTYSNIPIHHCLAQNHVGAIYLVRIEDIWLEFLLSRWKIVQKSNIRVESTSNFLIVCFWTHK